MIFRQVTKGISVYLMSLKILNNTLWSVIFMNLTSYFIYHEILVLILQM